MTQFRERARSRAYVKPITKTVSAPFLESLSTYIGTAAGGTSVVCVGRDMHNATAVKFGTTSGTITANDSVSVTVTSPAHAAGAVQVTVVNADGTSNGLPFLFS